ncbi:ribosomal RNA-processing protein 8 [Xyrichtys novacula]|uniref:Ribosomal RNA-processing protein 8 n=1 Tax=Xyrichtys novacula TaxID=13765 RepID=A0AAV1FWW7_XYRNO|nr:ribosomal RNA-processing protein 8 [Xyrichtys novacula]
MFVEEEEWSDEEGARVLSKTVLRKEQKPENSSSSGVKPRAVGKKSLMRTLQTLGSLPEWKRDEHQQDSDSETDAALSPSKKKKKKKKPRKKRKQAETTGQFENGDLDQTSVEEKTLTKKRRKDNKFGDQKVENTCAGETKGEEDGKAVKANVDTAEDTERLSRQQWKNKMKNKRKCKNKYRQEEKSEEEVKKAETVEEPKPKENIKTDTNNNKSDNNTQTSAPKRGKEHKAEKRKMTEEDAEVSFTAETQTHREEKGIKTLKGSKQEEREPKVEITAEPQSPVKPPKPALSKEQNLKRERLRRILQSQEKDLQPSPAEQRDEPAALEPAVPEPEVKLDRSASLRSRMEQRLESARFRYINEVLYSTTSGEARRMFRQDPEAFGIYHRGYTAQVQRWPSNPVDSIISFIQHKPPSLVVADFGCGDCKIARSVKNKVHSFDLAATCELVTVCDMANVPLPDSSVDIAVFCLSLMGTNLADFLAEANRVLKMGGILKIAEVASRFENVRSFLTALANLGFKMVSKDTENTHFYAFECVKIGNAPENVKKFGLELKPCVYKKR